MHTHTTNRRCGHDTGSMYGNQPACDAYATRALTFDAYGGPITYYRCDPHARALKASQYPARLMSDGPASAWAYPQARNTWRDADGVWHASVTHDWAADSDPYRTAQRDAATRAAHRAALDAGPPLDAGSVATFDRQGPISAHGMTWRVYRVAPIA